MKGFHTDTVYCNSVVIRGVDGTDPVALGTATQEGRRRCHQLARFLNSDVPGFEAARMSTVGPTVGVRETRRLEALYQVTGADLARAIKFDDGVVCCDNPIDDVMRHAVLLPVRSALGHALRSGAGGSSPRLAGSPGRFDAFALAR